MTITTNETEEGWKAKRMIQLRHWLSTSHAATVKDREEAMLERITKLEFDLMVRDHV